MGNGFDRKDRKGTQRKAGEFGTGWWAAGWNAATQPAGSPRYGVAGSSVAPGLVPALGLGRT